MPELGVILHLEEPTTFMNFINTVSLTKLSWNNFCLKLTHFCAYIIYRNREPPPTINDPKFPTTSFITFLELSILLFCVKEYKML